MLLDYAPHGLVVVYHRAGAQRVIAEGLALFYALKERRGKCFNQAALVDVMCSEVAEDTRLHIAAMVYVEILPASGDAATSERTMVPEIDEQYRLRLLAVP